MIKYIFLDMDGVLVDLIPALLRHHGLEHRLNDWPEGCYSTDWLKVDDFFAPIADVYMQAQRSQYAYKLLDYCKSQASVAVLTDPFGISDIKIRWLNYYLPTYDSDKTIFASDKHWYAQEDTLLIDDCEANCDEWREAGGVAYCWPQPWNFNDGDPFEALKGLI